MCRQAVADEKTLRAALAEAEIVPQLLLYCQLTGDMALAEKVAPFIEGGWSHMEKIPQDLRDEISDALVVALKRCAAGELSGAEPTLDGITRLLSVGVSQPVPDDYGAMFKEEAAPLLGKLRSASWRRQPSTAELERYPALIVGAGLSGICMGIVLKKAGIPFEIIEKNDEVGGTWYENQYPGAGVDIPSHVYSFSFAPNPDWERAFGLQGELLRYLVGVADRFDLRSHIRFRSEVVEAVYNRDAANWTVTVRDDAGALSERTVKVFIPAVGTLNRPAVPDIPGIRSFEGPLFHTAEWDHDADLSGRRVALIGTGASSVQVGPTIAPDVERLLIFQRSPGWVALNESYHTVFSPGMKWASRHVPYLYMWYRFLLFWASGDVNHSVVQIDPNWDTGGHSINARNHEIREKMIRYIEAELQDRPGLAEKVIPNYPPWGKRMLRDNNWFKMLGRDNVELIGERVTKIGPDCVFDAAGNRYDVDAIIMATGFKALEILAPMKIVGNSDKSINEVWNKEGARALYGMTVPDFPNMFILGGPNTGLSHGGGLFFYAEMQAQYIMQCLREMIEASHETMEVRQIVHDEYNRRVDEMLARMVWSHKGVRNWYKNDAGRVVILCPWRLVDYWKMTRALNPDDFVYS